MRYINLLLLIVFSLVASMGYAQNDLDVLGESSLAVNYKVSKNYITNFALRSRYFLYRDAHLQYNQQQMDVFHFSTFKLDYSHDLSFGIYYRERNLFDTGSDEWRFTQQFNYKKQRLAIRFGHRFRTEQRIFNSEVVFRQRYRFAIDFPLNGEKLNIGEPYLIMSSEALLSLSHVTSPELDHRTTIQIGFQMAKHFKFQTGLEHRIEGFNLKGRNMLFLFTSAILSI